MSDRLYRRGTVWWGWFYDSAGQRVRRSTRQRDRRAAEQVLRRWERAAQAPGGPASHAPQTVADACEALLGEPNVNEGTQHMRGIKAGHLARLLGSTRLALLKFDDVRAYCEARTEVEGAAPGTVSKELSTLSQALRVASERGWWTGDPKALMPRWRTGYVPRETRLSRDQVDALCAVLPEHRALWVRVAVLTGGRDSEVEGLKWGDVDFARGWVTIRGTKTDTARRKVPLADELRVILEAVPKKKRTGPITLPWGNVRRDLHAAAERASRPGCRIPPVTPNDLRRTFASWLVDAGVPLKVVARLLGHSSTRMVDRVYGHVEDDTLQAAVGRLPKGV